MMYGSDYISQTKQGGGAMESDLMLFAGNSHLQFARKIATHLGLELCEPDMADSHGPQIKWFSNENCMVDVKAHVRKKHCFVIQTQAHGRALLRKDGQGNDVFGPELRVSDMIIELILLVNALKSSGAARVTAVMPYMPYVRSDKKDHPHVSIGARVFADLLTATGVDGILLMDPHFAQIHGFFDEKKVKVDVLKAKPLFARYFLENYDLRNFALIAPDVNEAKHSGPMAGLLGLPMAIVDKRREDDSETPKAVALIGENDVQGMTGIMFDDEIASGGTVIEGADFVVSRGVQSVLPAPTHAVFSSLEGLGKLAACPNITSFVTTDTIPFTEEKRQILPNVHVIPVAEHFAEAIRIIHEGGDLEVYKKSLYDGLKELRK